MGAIAAAHQATVQIYRLGHESVHPLFRHHVRLARPESDASLLRMLLVLQERAARAELGPQNVQSFALGSPDPDGQRWSHSRIQDNYFKYLDTLNDIVMPFKTFILTLSPLSFTLA